MKPTTFLTGAVITAVFATSVQAQDFTGVTLRIGTWGGPWKESQEELIVGKFAELGGRIEFVTAGQHVETVCRARAGNAHRHDGNA